MREDLPLAAAATTSAHPFLVQPYALLHHDIYEPRLECSDVVVTSENNTDDVREIYRD